MKIKNFLTRYRLPILSGILIGTSYIPFPPWAIYFCFVPLWIHWLNEKSYRKIFISGWVTQYLFTLIGFNWVAHTVHEFGHLPLPAAFVTLLIFCGFANLYVPLAGLLWNFLRQKFHLSPTYSLILLAPCVALAERFYPMIFDWNYGYSLLWINAPIAQWAEFIGFEGLSAFAIFLNWPLLYFWQNRKSEVGKRALYSVLALVFIMNLSGYFLVKRLDVPDKNANVLIVQANIGNLEKQAAEKGRGFRFSIAETYFRLTRKGLMESENNVDFVVWPETAYPERVIQNKMSFGLSRRLQNFIQQNQINLVSGVYSIKSSTGQVTNSFATFGSDGVMTDSPYHKSILLAFGEFIPGAEWFPVLKTWLPQVADFGRGNGPEAKGLNQFRLGPQICYEGLFPWFAKKLADQNIHMIVNLTNDSWYGKWQEPYQHLHMTLARAIEFRRPVIRSTNTGISTVALADGTVLEQSPLHVEWTHTYEIPYYEDPIETFYQKIGIYMVPLMVFLFLIVTIIKGRREKSVSA